MTYSEAISELNIVHASTVTIAVAVNGILSAAATAYTFTRVA